MHFGRVAELLYEKGGELPLGHPDRKFKGRCVFLGDNVRDEHNNYAVFEEIGQSPSSIEAGRAVDAMSLFEHYVLEQSDAVSAYTQSFLTGPPTWVSLPKERWPQAWVNRGFQNPVCPLVLNLYGHPLAGNVWGSDCEKRVLSCGWQKIPNWPCVYHNPKAKALLVVYVDDFKLAAKRSDIAGLWTQLRSCINLDDPTPPERFLGCYTRRFVVNVKEMKPMLQL